MATILIVYATTEGQTEKIAGYMAGRLRAKGAVVDTTIADAVPPELDVGEYDAVIVGASVHLGRYQKAVVGFISENAQALGQTRSAFYSVSAAAANPEERKDVVAIMEKMFSETGWKPKLTANLAGAVRYLHYGPITRYIMRRISEKEGGGTDTRREYEYTDWDEVDEFVDRVLTATASRRGRSRSKRE